MTLNENKQEHIADIYEKDRKTSVSLPPAPCVGECKEVRFRGPTLRTEHRDTEHVSRGDWVVMGYLSKTPICDVQHL